MNALVALGRALVVEALKLRRTPALLATLGAPACLALLVSAETSGSDPARFWSGLLKTAVPAWTIFLLPLLVTLHTALLAGVEHTSQSWKHLLALPLPRWVTFAAKLLVAWALVGLATLLALLAVSLVGAVKMFARAELASAGPPPLGEMFQGAVCIWVGSLLILAVQSWFSIRWQHFAVAVGVGIGGTFFSLFAASSRYGSWLPWLYPFLATGPERAWLALWLGGVGGALAGVFSCIDLSTRQEGDWRWPGPRLVGAGVACALGVAGVGVLGTTWRHFDVVERRMARVERGLVPAFAMKGAPRSHALQDRMRFYQVPGVSIAAVQDGRLTWARAYGLADTESGTPVLVDTLFQAASVSKPVAAVVALAASERGHFALDDDVNTRLKSWHLPESDLTRTRKVTPRDLLSHTGGIVEHRVVGYVPGDPVPSVWQTLDGQPPSPYPPVRVESIPGTRFSYAGGGYLILQQMLEDLLDTDFADIARRFVLEPAGMTSSTFEQPLAPARQARAARGHDAAGAPMRERWRVLPERAACGLWTTPSDLARFACEFLACVRGRSSSLVSAATARLMLTKRLGPFGLGFTLSGTPPDHLFMHEGANMGYRCSLVMNRDTGDGLVVMTNGDRGGELMREIVRAFAGEFGWAGFRPRVREAVRIDPAPFPQYTGVYQLEGPDEVKIRVTTDAGHLYFQNVSYGQDRAEMHALGPNRFFILEDDGEMSFELGAGGRAEMLVTTMGTTAIRAVRIE